MALVKWGGRGGRRGVGLVAEMVGWFVFACSFSIKADGMGLGDICCKQSIARCYCAVCKMGRKLLSTLKERS